MKKPGEFAGGKKIEVLPNHIPEGISFEGVEDWSDAIFASPSIYYCSHSTLLKVVY
jgi:hypothetical protein